ncbi:tellurite resistance TerB family protein [Paracoccus marinus]|uniref:tellurite resistance TerB family protein n=1 Tax=Paracoccus marinus TaxID=288426 RepID=UPI00103F1366|nr:tellurite resistance TerB family protein [Paracoccus marinus]
MSMMKSLARVAAGVMLAKGIGTMMQQQPGRPGEGGMGQGGRTSRSTGGGLLGELLGGGRGGASSAGMGGGLGGGLGGSLGGALGGAAAGGGLGGILGQVLGGRTAANPGTGRPYGGQAGDRTTGHADAGHTAGHATSHATGSASGGLGGLIDGYMRRAATSRGAGASTGASTGASAGAGGGLLGGLLGGAAAGGMLGDLLRGPARHGSQPQNDRSFGELFNDSLATQDEPEVAPTPEQNAVAGLMLRAMLQAAKSDGKIDDAEKQRLLSQIGDLDDEDRQFIRDQMAAPVDAQALARDVPKGLETQVYMMSLLAIDFDHEEEARYLRELAQALGLQQDAVNDVHEQVGVQNLN